MTKAFEVGPPEIADKLDEDTIEMELSPDDLLALSRSAEEEHATTPLVETNPTAAEPASVAENSFASDAARSDRWPLARVTGVLGIAAAVIVLGSASHRET